MADEARAMLDALMGADRNTALPPGTAGGGGSDGGGGNGPTMPSRRKRSCYDHNICPLYCAWGGTDVHELFTNTKSDIGPNPRICDDHAREEYAALPDQEKDRLGFERVLYDRLRDLVRGCDRTVHRNKEKLRQELARQQRKHGGKGDGDDPAANISEEKVLQVAEDMARLDLLEEEIARSVKELKDLDGEESGIVAAAASAPTPTAAAETPDTSTSHAKSDDSKENGQAEQDKAESEAKGDADANKEKDSDKKDTSTDKGDEDKPVKDEKAPKEEPEQEQESAADDDETKSKLRDIRSKKRTILSELASKLERIAPLRDAIEAETRRLHYFRSDTTIDKCVCEVSGNFMSYRDADERIAAHYAGKQYVGWKMVRDKHSELKKKYGNMSGPPRGGPPMPYDRRGGPPQGYGPPPERRGRYGGGGGGGGHDYRHGGGYGGSGGGHRRDDRSRSRDHDRNRGRKRSPDRWERDRGPRDYDRGHGGGGGGHRGRW
mmetsp:Transcript_14766/g.29827  ORF Transcript_14766/g.29827 Transcript_14766/m.29827 type:complete len:492 (-) Transcript_14766:641-2116(-)|eukprot:CAMPEP_0178729910 /NCGR_PEP_ID=MMETSP0699-20121125/29227_1 /TAXON_ID=265572 /ORGANISM="Extubocellulus spinifer, Strain CCMP396" /LENGTH=491 /DNA_ID=CAMNT_0020381879 /DNA_START=68 /DNA_END=1543 /DNA_ORIENTATION=+